jgi:hypothetical protein
MFGNLPTALRALLVEALPDLLGGATPPIKISVTGDAFEIDTGDADPDASAPRPDDRTDNLPFNAGSPAGPYRLSQPPYPGPRRVSLVTSSGERRSLREDEVAFNTTDPRTFLLNLRPWRDLTGITGVHVLYGVVSVFTRVKAKATLTVHLESTDPALLEQTESLIVGIIALNRPRLIADAGSQATGGDYGAGVEIKALHLRRGARTGATVSLLTLAGDIELKAVRALGADEGRPIVRITTPGVPLDPRRPVNVRIDVDT